MSGWNVGNEELERFSYGGDSITWVVGVAIVITCAQTDTRAARSRITCRAHSWTVTGVLGRQCPLGYVETHSWKISWGLRSSLG
jgi:hypothetical protein